MRRLLFLSILAARCFTPVLAQPVTITVSNPTAAQRQELVAIDASQLPFAANKGVIVRDAFGIERVTQLTRDGKLLLEVHLHPHGTASYTIQPGIPAALPHGLVVDSILSVSTISPSRTTALASVSMVRLCSAEARKAMAMMYG